uniref:VCBS repeat-containing protein n=1 Tax=uncultured Armatimonadetes bacterium TaxID=157466 RepID=A0A6J4IXZ8_9BACT|nr:hypothetical protein AVDCRST_MAG63-2618 [uncultured Armatimonadetes bacterium]
MKAARISVIHTFTLCLLTFTVLLFGTAARPARADIDLNNDGPTDVLLQHTSSGAAYYWLLEPSSQGHEIVEDDFLWTGGNRDWEIIGASYLNGDGRHDVLLQNRSSGAVYYWLIGPSGSGVRISDSDFLWSGGDNRWKAVGTPHLDYGDIRDLLFQYGPNGAVYFWSLDTNAADLPYIADDGFLWNGGDSNWKVVGTPDLNADRVDDVVLQHASSGAVYYWTIDPNGPRIDQDDFLWEGGDRDWRLVGTPDLNSDGHDDLLFQNAWDGAVYYWLIDDNGSGPYIYEDDFLWEGGDANWVVRSTGDLNGDRTSDILFQYLPDGATYYWLISDSGLGIDIVDDGYLWSGGDAGWRVIRDR